MSNAEAAGIFAILVAMGTTMMIFSIVWYVFQVIARWKIFTKAGEAGWKSIIPIYNDYILYKMSWNPTMFWAYFGCALVGLILSNFASNNAFFGILAFIFLIGALVVTIMQLHKLSKAFGYGTGFTVGLVLLNPIFMLILGFGSSQYQGIQE